MKLRHLLHVSLVLLVVLTLTAPLTLSAHADNPKPAVKSVILLIGDGMGINQTRIAAIYARDVLGIDPAIDTIQTRGLMTTYSADSEITDSSSAATAMYSGYKINNGVVNILPDPDGRWTYTIGQAAHDAGKAVGVVTTTRVTHATPAAVYAHVIDRDDENLIAEQMVEFGPEVALAGGWRHFVPQSTDGSKREDDRDLLKEMQTAGYTEVTNAQELEAVDTESTDHLVGLFTKSHMAYEIDRENESLDQPSLEEMTRAALNVLDNNLEGFFLMVEGGRIDHAAHAHDAISVIYDTLAFDAAVKAALEYQSAHPDVLVIVTADHETGGLGLGRDNNYFTNIAALQTFTCSMEDRIATFKADEILDKAHACGFSLTDEQTALLSQYPAESAMADITGAAADAYGAYSWGHAVLSEIESEVGGINWTTWAHTAQPIIVYASGPAEGMFSGSLDNTDLAERMALALGVELLEPYTPQ